ncbi:MAG: hypothetical protein AABZ15_08025 [Nitrospirota bacterium]
MKHLNWLHFTDLHFGISSQEWLWPNYRNELFDDLKRLRDTAVGPWDVVFFSGDLTQSGTKDQFEKLTEALSQLWNHFASLDCKPILLCVPGNHDLIRPSSTHAIVKALKQWHKDTDIRNEFWSSDSNQYIDVVKDSFANYNTWWSTLSLRKPHSIVNGLLPGDFSTIIDKSGFRLGVVGLNTAFLQLTDEDYERKLDFHEKQLIAVCNGDPHTWCEKLDLALLMTHHGQHWLHKGAEQRFLSEIYPPGLFHAHLYGHLHEPDSLNFSQGGAAERRFRQGISLFGLKTWGNSKVRVHGYAAGRFELSGAEGFERIWPRRLTPKMAGHLRLGPDSFYDIDENNCVVTKFTLKKNTGTLSSKEIHEPAGQELITHTQGSADGHVVTAQNDNFGISISLLSDSCDIDSAKKKLKLVPRLILKTSPQHYTIRQAEQARFESLILKDRCAWLVSDWGLGKDDFIACVIERLSRHNKYEVYKLICDEIDNLSQLETQVVKQFGITLQEFCNFNSLLTNTILLLDDISPQLYNTEDGSTVFHQLLSTVIDFCPGMCLILNSRQRPSNKLFGHVDLKPLDITETASYIANHPKAGQELRDVDSIDVLHLRSEGLPMHLDRLIDSLQVLSLRELVDIEFEVVPDHMSGREPVPMALKQAVATLSQSTDRYTRRSFRMLKVLSILPEGETLQAIRRAYPAEPFYPQNAFELINLSLAKVEAHPSFDNDISLSPIKSSSSAEDDANDKRLCVPRQVRDYLNSTLSKEEREDIVRCSSELLFGDKWREGKVRISRIKSLGGRGARSTGPGNEHAIVLQLLKDAIYRKDEKEISRTLVLGINYCSTLKEYNRFKDGSIASEDVIALIRDLDFNKEFIELAIINGECLRMTGQRDKALEIFQKVLDRNIDYLSSDRLADVYLEIALIHDQNDNGEQAIKSAQKAQELLEKDSSRYIHTEAIIVRFQEKDPIRKALLQDLEKKARSKDYLSVANNIALDLARRASDEDERLSLLERVLAKNEDPYNRIRAVVNKANYLLLNNKPGDLLPRDYQLLTYAYSFLFAQRLTALFTLCHKAIWGLLKNQHQTRQLLKIFRLSSFIWRIRGEENTEKTYLEEIRNIDVGEVKKLNDERIAVDIIYFERRTQFGDKNI